MTDVIYHLFDGIGLPEVAITTNRLALGVFFTISGYHKLFNRKRHATIARTMRHDHVFAPGVNEWLIPVAELLGGLGLTVGLLSTLAALGLLVVCVGATWFDGLARIPAMRPIDLADRLCCVLYLPEVLYAVMLFVVVMTGGGPYSLDAVVLRWL